jgi:hypothetical protein
MLGSRAPKFVGHEGDFASAARAILVLGASF